MRVLTIYLFILLLAASCRPGRISQTDDGKIQVTIVQVNDVYEIAPLEAGRTGGIARVATIRKQQLAKNPNTLLVMAGDFLSPSVYGSLTYQGKRIRGRQMVDAMNAAGFDLVCFGNHEFDISEKELQERINESEFQWVSSNAFHRSNKSVQPFQHQASRTDIPRYYFINFRDADGTTARIGFLGLVLPSNPAEYVHYEDAIASAKQVYDLIRDSCDAVVALTHLQVNDDKKLVDAIPGIAVVLGGHEHDMRIEKENGVYITKAHANAKSAYVVQLEIDKKEKKTKANPELVYLDEKVALDSLTNLTVQKWMKIAADVFGSSGFNPFAVVPYKGDPLEGREGPVRSSSTNLTRLITDAMLFAAPQAQASIFNAGSIRVDDVLHPPVTQYDILRTLPFGGGIRELDVTGALLLQVLEAGRKNSGTGGYLQHGNIRFDESAAAWEINGVKIDSLTAYRIVVPDFLISGKETNLGFFNEKNPGVLRLYPPQTIVGTPQSDIRIAVIRYLEERK